MSKEDKNFIAVVIALLKGDEYYGAGKHVEIAKGKHAMPYSFKSGINKIKRLLNERG